MDKLGKKPITILVKDIITAYKLAPLFLLHVIRHISILEIIISDYSPQFIFDFWNEFYKRISIKLKLLTANHLQTNNQTKIVN